MKKLALIALSSLVLATAGCSSLLTQKTPPPTIYALHAAAPENAGEEVVGLKKAKVISLAEPGVPAGFDTDRIALFLDNGRRLDYYANAKWPEHLGEVIQNVLIESAPVAEGITVVPPDAAAQPAYRLIASVLDFAPHYQGGANGVPQLNVTVNFRLVEIATDRLVLDVTLPATAAASANTQTAVVGGLEALLQQVTASAYEQVSAAVKPKRAAKKPQ